MGIERTTIGSFPRSEKPLGEAVRDVLDLQLRYGIDVVTDGEQRADMITYFEQIPGFGRGGRGLRVSGKIKPMDDPNDFYKISDFALVESYLSAHKTHGIKGKITLARPRHAGNDLRHGWAHRLP